MLPVFSSQEVYSYKTILKLDAGKMHSGLLTTSGELFIWGEGTYGRIGHGKTTNEFLPVNITTSSSLFSGLQNDRIIDFSLGAEHSGAITQSGRVFMWGAGADFRLGNASTSNTSTPIEITNQFPAGDKVIRLALGGQHSAALTSSGNLYMWGKGDHGRLGNNRTWNTNLQRPTLINQISGSLFSSLTVQEKIIDIKLGSEFSAALTSAGRLFTWGRGNVGQIGNGSNSDQALPVNITSRFSNLGPTEVIIDFSLGREHGIALTNLGKVFTWGGNSDGRLGNNTKSNANSPINISSQGDFSNLVQDRIVKVQAGFLHSGALTSSGKAFLWGENNRGRLGNGNQVEQTTPKLLSIQSSTQPLTHIALGWQHSLVSTDRIDISSFGDHTLGQLGIGEGVTLSLEPRNISVLGALLPIYNQNIAIRVMNEIALVSKTITIANRSRMLEINALYNLLNQEQKILVTNHALLTSSIAQVDNLILEYTNVINLINAIPTQLDIQDVGKISQARTAYDALTLEQQTYINNLSKLENAENQYRQALNEIQEVVLLISNLPTSISLVNEDAILLIQQRYALLSSVQQERVENYPTLLAAIQQINTLNEEINSLIQRIASLPSLSTFSLEDELTINQIRASYQLLDSIQKTRVTNFSDLVVYENIIIELKSQAQAINDRLTNLPMIINLDTESLIVQIRQDYDLLHPSQQALVTNTSILINAENSIARLYQEIASVIDDISNLPLLNNITLSDEASVIAIRNDYDRLNSLQKNLVTNLNVLLLIEDKIQIMLSEVSEVIDQINSIPTSIDLNHQEEILVVKSLYDQLDNFQQSRVTNVSKLNQALSKINELLEEVESVQTQIQNLPQQVTLEHRDLVEETKALYDQLSDDQKARIGNIPLLENAEASIANLESQKEDFISLVNTFTASDLNENTLVVIQHLLSESDSFDSVMQQETEDSILRLKQIESLIIMEMNVKGLFTNPTFVIGFILSAIIVGILVKIDINKHRKKIIV